MNSDVSAACEFLHQRAQTYSRRFHTAVILGSGLGAVADAAISAQGTAIAYADIPGMPQTGVAGHAGRLVVGAGELDGTLFFQGRAHYYEGHSVDSVTFATRFACSMGIDRLIVTNAAGGIPSHFRPGDLMLINGHWTFLHVAEAPDAPGAQGRTPLLWNELLRDIATKVDTPLKVHQGVYAMMSGPNYETPAEVRMLRNWGISAVGMSTIPEALAAVRRGVRVLGVSCITNVASGLSDQPLDHAEVSHTAGSIETEFTSWMLELLSRLRILSQLRKM